MKQYVAIIDCGVGNHASVSNALRFIGVESVITSDAVVIASATHLILPGVGSFAEGMHGIHERKLQPILEREVLEKRKPILGICLGMQLFATEGHEYGVHRGLGWIAGTVVLIDVGDSKIRLPHIGWNNVTLAKNATLTQNFSQEPTFYFVHSYHLIPADSSVIVGTCDYGTTVTALVEQGNIFGAQFHPEKSHDDGMQIFRNFLTAASC